jgi:hypothetical protein
MRETLRQQQSRFARSVADLILKAHELGFQVTLGDAYRDPRVFGPMGSRRGYGRPNSQHKQRLAIDLNLFRDGHYLSSTEAHRPLGEWWERQHPDARWGGRWEDGNHYSLERGGFK